ncbi:MAG: ribosome maturation factor RimP [Anaerovoracaceae bacterium]|jgi:ribosome maturation factor RimP
MAKENIREAVAGLLDDFLTEHGYELYHVEFVKEASDWFLRVYIDRSDGVSVGTDDCETVSRYLSDRLDAAGLIRRSYYLEVSSPGMDRELIRQEHFDRYAGEMVEVRLYRAAEGKKEWTAQLVARTEDALVLRDDDGKTVELPRDLVAKIRLAVII